jgi:hypothetical protein
LFFLSFVCAEEAVRPVVIKVYSIPGGASFWIDGMDTNLTTPCTISMEFSYDGNGSIIPKKYTLLKDGYEPYTKYLRGPQDSTINAILQPLKK